MSTLHVDGNTLRTANELWSAPDAEYDEAVISAPRSARDLLRVLVSLDRLVKNGGVILIHPTVSQDSSETRAEATEIFCGAYPHWKRRLVEDKVVELRKLAGAAVREPSPPLGAVHPAPAGRRIVSLALFGTDERYWKCLPTYVRAHHTLLPDYELRIHHDDAIYNTPYGDVLCALERQGLVNLVRVEHNGIAIGKTKAMLWRLLPIWDESVDYVFCRDLDSLPTWRERCANEEFIASECAAGVIHDNIHHVGVLGGLCHFNAQLTRTEWKSLAYVNDVDLDWHLHGTDQDRLNLLFLRLPSILEHSLVKVTTEDGSPLRREKTWPQSTIRYEVKMTPPPRGCEVDFANYMGAAQHESGAFEWYNEFCPALAAITAAEAYAQKK